MFCLLTLLHYATIFLALMLFALQGYCQKQSPDIDSYLVSFEPAVTIHNEEHLLNCTGVILSPERIAMPSACVVNARQLRQSGVVTVKNYQGEYIGQLPAIGDQVFDAIQTWLEPEREVPFVSDLKPDDAFPVFLDTDDLETGDQEAGNYHLRSLVTWKDENVNQHLQLQKLSSGKDKFGFLPGDSALLKQLPPGSPLVDGKGRVACLLGGDGVCESVKSEGVGVNDGSCHIPYFRQGCGNEAWSFCENKKGVGLCTNEVSHEQCQVAVMPDMFDYNSLHCRNHEGCGGIRCPSSCDPEAGNCDCVASWGLCELKTRKSVTKPTGCISQVGGNGNIDTRCGAVQPTTEPTTEPTNEPTTPPNDFQHSPAFLGVIIGVPTAVVFLGVTAVVAIVAIACKYGNRAGYGSIQ